METLTKAERDLEIIRRMLVRKKEIQQQMLMEMDTDPEIKAAIEKLKAINGKRKSA